MRPANEHEDAPKTMSEHVARENFIQNFVLSASGIIIYVVNRLTENDQNRINRLCELYPDKIVFVAHNVSGMRNCEAWEDDVLFAFNATKTAEGIIQYVNNSKILHFEFTEKLVDKRILQWMAMNKLRGGNPKTIQQLFEEHCGRDANLGRNESNGFKSGGSPYDKSVRTRIEFGPPQDFKTKIQFDAFGEMIQRETAPEEVRYSVHSKKDKIICLLDWPPYAATTLKQPTLRSIKGVHYLHLISEPIDAKTDSSGEGTTFTFSNRSIKGLDMLIELPVCTPGKITTIHEDGVFRIEISNNYQKIPERFLIFCISSYVIDNAFSQYSQMHLLLCFIVYSRELEQCNDENSSHQIE
eukprot:TRINITY_DN699_c0_g1_i3.p1 TRINITY_DN699_c0_g1~~TRINITY_DN699_c0_g1_i3.p1  ORF type:complete len:355 (+),score=24.86 TRINITY_DN699_c0_g1_i3:824-1888(+)